ncbi:MFS-type transporter SLC18B1-like [Sycon ciliatum]|uniref:MFS-type transporter SLC18B1-like n=1 Tax=Sycon ciliatum TaxID=27933 RepID=UPI0031F6C730
MNTGDVDQQGAGGGVLYCSDGDQDLFSGNAVTGTRDEAAAVGDCKKPYLVCGYIAATNFFIAAAVTLMVPIMALEAELKNPDASSSKGKSVSKHASVGLVFSIAKFTQVLVAPVLSSELGNIGSKYLLVLSTMAVAGCLVLFGFIAYVDDWIQFLLLSYSIRIAQGLFDIANLIAGYAILAVVLADKPAFANGLFFASNGFGYAFGPFLGSTLYSFGGFTMTFVVGGATLFLVAIILLLVMPTVDQVAERQAAGMPMRSNISTLELLTVPWLWAILLMLFLGNFVLGAVEPTLSLYFIRYLHTSTTISGLALLLFGVLFSGLTPLLGHIVDLGYVSIEAAQLIGLVSCGLAYQLVGPALFLGWPRSLALSFVSMAFFALGMAALLTVAVPDMTRTWSERGFGSPFDLRYVVSGLSRPAMALGYGAGSIVGSSVVAAVGFQNGMSVIGGVYFAVGLIVVARCLQKYIVLYRMSRVRKRLPAKD